MKFASLKTLATGLAAVAASALFALPALAADVTLRFKGGGFDVTGELKSFDGTRFVIVSPVYGNMTFEAARFECVSPACPKGPVSAPVVPVNMTRGGPVSKFTIAGSNTIGNQLMPSLIEAFAASGGLKATRTVGSDPLDLDYKLTDNQGRDVGEIALRRHGSSTSFRELERRAAEIGMSSRPIKGEEATKLSAAGIGDLRAVGSEHVLGLDGLMILVAPNNPAVAMSLENIAKIFSGQITNWSEVGLPAGAINLYAPGPDSGTYETFETLVLAPRKLKLAEQTKRTHNHAEQSDWVARDPRGIGVVGVAYQRNAKALNVESSCGLITSPTVHSMKTEEYPLSRRLFLYTAGAPRNSIASSLLNFSLSAAAQPIVKGADFVDQSPEALPFKEHGARMAYALNVKQEDFDADLMRELLGEVKVAQRLTSTFRFQTNSFQLDTKAQQDIVRLAEILANNENRGRQVALLGFADANGTFENNLRLAQSRADAVRRALVATPVGRDLAARLTAKGYSELAPVSCNDTDDARRFNRRVEVWLR